LVKLRRESHRNLKADTAEARRNERRLSGVGTNSATESHAPAQLWEKRVPPPPLWTHYNPISSKEFGGEPESLHIPPLCLVYYRLWATFRHSV